MYSTADRLVFAAQLIDFELTKVFMATRITRPDKKSYGVQPSEIKKVIACRSGEPTAFYADRKRKFGFLYGST